MIKRPMFMFEGEGTESGGGENYDPSQANAPTVEVPETPVTPAVTAVAPTQTLDPKQFAQEFGNVIADKFKQQAQPAGPKVYSPEEIAQARKALKIWEPDDNYFAKFNNFETQKAAFIEMRDAIFEQQQMITQAMLNQQNQSWEQRFQPVAQMLSQREENERVDRFHKSFPSLAHQELQPLISAVGQKLASAGKFNGLSESAAFTELAKGVESVIKVTNPTYTLETSTTNNSGRTGNQIASVSSGSGAGGGNAPTKPSGVAATDILGPVPGRKK